jgi:competence protein ComFB
MGDSKMDISLLKVKNRWEELVDTAIERMLEEGAFSCSCGKCRADVGAIALNSLPPDYVPVGVGAAEAASTGEDELQHRLSQAEAAVRRALDLVKQAPLHSGASEPVLVNPNEDLVRTVLADVLAHQKEEQWSALQLAWALAYSLRELPPKYTTTPKGQAYARADEIQPSAVAQVLVSVHSSLQRVKAEVSGA